MTTDTLIFKDKIIQGNDLELIFHKDVIWIYNETPYPIVKYSLRNCRNLETADFDSIDFYNDGVIIDTREEGNLSVFETTDMCDIKFKIFCDKIEKEEQKYNSQDLVDLIKEIIKRNESEYETVTMLNKRTEILKHFLNHELNIVTIKITQANWLTEDKKHFLMGQQEIIKKVLDIIDRN